MDTVIVDGGATMALRDFDCDRYRSGHDVYRVTRAVRISGEVHL